MRPVINAKNVYNNILNSNFIKNKLISDNPGEIAATIALASTTTKDAVNCYYYVTQSLSNKKIPEEKRKFVAGLDLSNGILNVLVQLGLGSVVNKYSAELFETWMGKSFNADAAQRTMKKLQQNGKNYPLEDIVKTMNKNKKWAKGGFQVIAVLLVTQVIAKRIIVPFLATPMAGIFKKQMEKKEANAKGCNGQSAGESQFKIDSDVFKTFDMNELASKSVKYQK